MDWLNASHLVWTGSEFGVSWEGDHIYFARLSSSGSKVGSDLQVNSAGNDVVGNSLSWTGSEFGVSWRDDRDGTYQIYFARVSSDGTKLGSDVQVTNVSSSKNLTSHAWSGSEFGVS
jgi:hypothetical protein